MHKLNAIEIPPETVKAVKGAPTSGERCCPRPADAMKKSPGARKSSLEAIKAKAKKAMRKGFSDAGLEEVVDPFQKVNVGALQNFHFMQPSAFVQIPCLCHEFLHLSEFHYSIHLKIF